MILLILIISASVVGIASVLKKRKLKNRAEAMDMVEISPTAVITVDLEDCILTSSKHYHELPETYGERFESLRSNFDPASKRIGQDVVILKYETEYKGKQKTFRSHAVPLDRATAMMKMILQKTTTIEIFEDDDGHIENYRFDTRFFYKRN